MTISNGDRVSIQYTLTLENDTVVESNVEGQPLEYVHGEGQLIPGLEHALEGMSVGESKEITVQPADAYGDIQDGAIQSVSKDQIPEHLQEVGAQLQAQTPDGQVLRARVTEISNENVVVDFNHPLAGQVLQFSIKVVDLQR